MFCVDLCVKHSAKRCLQSNQGKSKHEYKLPVHFLFRTLYQTMSHQR